MRFIKVESRDEPRGYYLSAKEYLEQLPALHSSLPSGAWSFASDPAHYDFYSERCVKDLKLMELCVTDAGDGMSVTARFGFNLVAPEQLTIRYARVVDLSVALDVGVAKAAHVASAIDGLGPIQLDEIWPNGNGCEHEIRLIGGSIRVVCSDLDASWHSRQA